MRGGRSEPISSPVQLDTKISFTHTLMTKPAHNLLKHIFHIGQ